MRARTTWSTESGASRRFWTTSRTGWHTETCHDPSPDVIIIGGGALGSAIAYYLAGMRAGRVVLLERRTMDGQSSAKAAGLISQARPHSAVIPLVLDGKPARRLFGPSPRGPGRTSWRIGTLGRPGDQKIDAYEAVRRVPRLAFRGDKELVLAPGNAYVDSYLLTRAFAEVARLRGVAIRERVELKAIRRQGDQVVGVETDDGFVPAGVVIDAAGAWAGILTWQLAIGLPRAPIRSHYWVTKPFRRFTPSHPIVFLPKCARAEARSAKQSA